jgi:hypothetical protein
MAGPVRPNPSQISRTPSYSVGKQKYFYTDSTQLQGIPATGAIAPVVKAPTSIPVVVPPAAPPGGSFPPPPPPAFGPQPAHFAFIGPVSGPPASPTFRPLTSSDLPPAITSINGDSTQAQVIAAGANVTVVSAGGTTTISASGGGGGGRATYSSVILSDAPTFYYQCRDLSGTTCTDASGNGHNGLYTGSPLLGHATLCGDVSDYAIHTGATSGNIGITSSTLPNTTAFTIEGIFEQTRLPIDTSHNYRILATDIFGSGTGFALAMNSSNSGFYVNFNVTGAGSLNTVQVAPFYSVYSGRNHIALVYTGSGIIIYVNGVSVYTSPAMTGTYAPSGGHALLYIGQDASTTECLIGALDEIALYGSALTAAQIRAHAAAMWTQ